MSKESVSRIYPSLQLIYRGYNNPKGGLAMKWMRRAWFALLCMAMLHGHEAAASAIYDYVPPPPGAPYSLPKWKLGVGLEDIVIYDPPFGAVAGVRIDYVVPGWPASNEGLESGDIITRVDGNRVSGYGDYLRFVTASSTGKMNVRVRDVRSGAYIDHVIQLVTISTPPATPGGGGGP